MDRANGREVTRVRLGTALPCGLDGCGRPAVWGTAEPDPDCPGLWLLLPLCEDCHKRLSEAGATAAGHSLIPIANR